MNSIQASFGRKLGNTFPVTLYLRTDGLDGSLETHNVLVSLYNETKGLEVQVQCSVDGDTVRFSFTAALQSAAGGTGFYTPRIVVDAGDQNIGSADWYKCIEIVAHSSQEYTRRNAGVNVGPVVLSGDLTLIANGLSAYELWKADGHEGSLSEFIEYLREPAETAAASVAEEEARRTAAERARSEAESVRALAEKLRMASEGQRASAETTRQDNEQTRQSQENARVTAEGQRASAETTRQDNEQTRQSQENARATAEGQRALAEITRQDNERTRQSQESTRATAEGQRASAEATRQDNERTRQSQESARESASQTAVAAANAAAAAASAVVKDAAAIREAADEALDAAREATAKAQELSDAVADVAALREDVDELLLGSHDHMAAAWDDGQVSPAASKTAGDVSIINYDMFLIDHTRNTEKVTHPVGKMKRNNYLRFDEGNFAPTVGITQSMYEDCMDRPLYLDGELYCAAGAFDPVAFLQLCTVEAGADGVYRLVHPVLHKDAADGPEVQHYLMPWETTSKDYSLFLGCEHPIYMLQNVKGSSGKVWNFLSTVRKSWDGHESVELKPTAFSPCPVGVIIDANNVRHSRALFCIYDGADAVYCGGRQGVGGNCSMFYHKGKMMPAANVMNQVTSMQYARNDNPVVTDPVPFAEGGYHALNTFLTYLEIKYGSRYLHAAAKFGSGISSNDGCSNEAAWKSNGGVRCRKVGDANWVYQSFGSKPSVIRRDATGTQWDAWTVLLNNYHPKEAVMESQMALSFAVEFGIDEGEEFEFYGNVYSWSKVSVADGPDEGHMSAIVRSIRSEIVSAYDAEGNAASFEIEASLRMSLFEGANICGDVFMYWGGGMELIGTCGENTAGGSVGHRIDVWSEPDQGKWLAETDVTHNDGADFACESEYTHLAHMTTSANGYSLKDVEMAPVPAVMGGSIGQGMCHYNYLGKYWASVVGAKARVGVRFRGFSFYSFCAPRSLHAYHGAGSTAQSYCGSAQVALPESATTTQS